MPVMEGVGQKRKDARRCERRTPREILVAAFGGHARFAARGLLLDGFGVAITTALFNPLAPLDAHAGQGDLHSNAPSLFYPLARLAAHARQRDLHINAR